MLLRELKAEEKEKFILYTQQAFQKGYEDYFGKCEDTIIPREDIEKSFDCDGSKTFVADENGEIVGGGIVVIDEKTQINELHILFARTDNQNKGVGFFVWSGIEKLFPDTKIWKTCTPYFDKRNINFYVNKCKFHIVRFEDNFSKNTNEEYDESDAMFEFEKVMNR